MSNMFFFFSLFSHLFASLCKKLLPTIFPLFLYFLTHLCCAGNFSALPYLWKKICECRSDNCFRIGASLNSCRIAKKKSNWKINPNQIKPWTLFIFYGTQWKKVETGKNNYLNNLFWKVTNMWVEKLKSPLEPSESKKLQNGNAFCKILFPLFELGQD